MGIFIAAMTATLITYSQPGEHPEPHTIAKPKDYNNVLPFIPKIAFAFEY